MATPLTAQAETGRTPSVLAVARRPGIANTTFRRHYPHLCEEIAAAARRSPATDAAEGAYAKLVTDNARLRRANRDAHARARVTCLRRNPL
ncbi:hypothetical protein ACFXPY_15805 [Streptomyces sp. NPDC059153]|uniref:hypothetical protein n=1 Tax=Streptomyces sp. NPDC059153 TaxID=3346743 RepID=UPI0036A47715